MTRARAGELAVNTILTVVGAIAVLVLSGAWSLKANTSDVDRKFDHLQSIQQRTLDAFCDYAKQQPRACSPLGNAP